MQAGEEQEMDLREFLRVVLKHKKLIAWVLCLVVAAALAYVLVTPKIYEAKVTIKVPDSKTSGSDILQELAALSSNGDPIATFVEVAKSDNVATRLARKVRLTAQPEYAELGDLESAVDALKDNLDVQAVKLSNILTLSVKSQDPQLAARMADAYAAGFIEANLDFSRVAAKSQRIFIEDQLAQTKERLVQSEEILGRFSSKEKRLGAVISSSNSFGSSGGSGGASPDQDRDPLVQLKTQILNLEIDRAALASRYSPEHPKLKAMDQQIQEAQAQLDKEVASLPKTEIDYLRLDRDVQVDEAIYNLLLQKLQECRIAENVDDSGIVVVDKARVPNRAVAPRKGRILIVSLIVGLLLGFGLAYGLERWHDEVGGQEDLQRTTGLPLLGLVPDWHEAVEQAQASKKAPKAGRGQPDQLNGAQQLILQERFLHSHYAESFKMMRTNLMFAGKGESLRTLLLVSPGAGEGKTLNSANLAISLAQDGKRVLLVDADLRKPSVHKIFELANFKKGGLPALITGQAELKDLVAKGPVPGLDLLPCAAIPPNPSELLGSARMAQVLKDLAAAYDHVLFDAAPVLLVTDSVVLASQMDGVLLLARFESTRRDELCLAREQLYQVKAHLLGCVLNAVQMRKYNYAYGKRYYHYHYGQDGGHKDALQS
jgi:tyrosine-protein kinase Etk/Wzc